MNVTIPTRPCPHCGDPVPTAADRCPSCAEVVPPPVPRQVTSDSKPCPICGETILAVAKKCRYCGEFLDKASAESARPSSASNKHGGTATDNPVTGRASKTQAKGPVSPPVAKSKGFWLGFLPAAGLGILGLFIWLAISVSREDYRPDSQGTIGSGLKGDCESARSEARELYRRCEKANSECGACLNGAKDEVKKATCEAFCATNTLNALSRLRQIAAAGCSVEEGPCR